LLDSLTATLETAKKNGTLLRVVAVYEAYFGAKDKSALMTAVDELAQKKIVDDKKQAALKDLIQNQPH
jgi:hypothetical protein